MNDVAVLVPSHDEFADVWPIAATLFERFWPDRDWPMYWMTNTKTPPAMASALRVPTVARDQWGINIAKALDEIRESLVLFWVEEILLLSEVPNDALNEARDILLTHSDIGIVNLTRYYVHAGFAASLDRVGSFAYYENRDIGFTAALPTLFRKSVLRHLVTRLPKSNEFEQQSYRVMLRDLPQIRSLVPARRMFRFCDNAITVNQWRKCAVRHLEKMGFMIDVSKRGVYSEECRLMDGAEA